MRLIISIVFFFIFYFNYSQNGLESQLGLIEEKIESKSMNSFEKLEIDLDNDNDLDYVYLYQCAEPRCIEVYLNINQKLEKVISEFCYDYYLYDDEKKGLVIKQNHCCGESPFTSNRVFNFDSDKAIIKENYVVFNDSYELLKPELYLTSIYDVKILNKNYNVRFSPNIGKYDNTESIFSCEPNTNIIGKLKQNSSVKVLAELIKEKRIWLFVEIDNDSLNFIKCENPIDFDYENQKLRGWISNNFVEKIKK